MAQSLHDEPAALVLFDISSDFADDFRISVTVEIVVLDLEVLAHWNQDVFGCLEGRLRANTCKQHAKSNGQVEAVVGCLVLHNELVAVIKSAN